jgi:hypothetical protein
MMTDFIKSDLETSALKPEAINYLSVVQKAGFLDSFVLEVKTVKLLINFKNPQFLPINYYSSIVF